MTQGPCRSLLFAPGNHSRKTEKVFTVGADVAILDLEDAVAVAEKPGARAAVVEVLKQPRTCKGYVRVNARDTEFCEADLKAVVGPWLDGIMLPKVESAAELLSVDKLILGLEREHGMEPGGIDLLPIVETAKGVDGVSEIAGSGSRVRRLSFGAIDLARDLGLRLSEDEGELTPARWSIALASRVARLDQPLDSVWAQYKDTDGLRKSSERARDLGFQGKMAIHPDQVAAINDVFTPGDDEAAQAEKIIAAFKEAEAAGSASIQVDGLFVDYPVVEQARRTLELIKRMRGDG